jgi:hypothetical protein
MNVTDEIKLQVWERATSVPGFDERVFRKDPCGAWIIWDRYGMADNLYGWEIDHIVPVAVLKEKNIPDEKIDNLINLRAMQCDNNRRKSDDYPSYFSSVTSDGNQNIRKEQSRKFDGEKNERLKAFLGI